tara:strand:+ start:467 stop:640 length:174 start_codon:yes stop_codon:yes gene_type:complete
VLKIPKIPKIPKFKIILIKITNCPGGGIGRHKGLKIPRRQLRAGSSPALGTITTHLA